MIKIFELNTDSDTSIILQIDTDGLTAELASEINNFWSSAKEVLNASDGCVFQAVARRAAGPLLEMIIQGASNEQAVKQLSEREGWPLDLHLAMLVIGADTPCLDPDYFIVRKLS